MFHLYLKFDEIHLSSFKSGQRYDLTLVQTFGKKKKVWLWHAISLMFTFAWSLINLLQ